MSSLQAFLVDLIAPWTTHLTRLQDLESRMTNAESAAYDRAAEVVGLVRAEFASLRQQIADAATAGAAALENDAQADADRINGLIDELATVLPANVPDVPVPAPGEPAELPTEPSQPAEPVPAETPAESDGDAPPAA